MGWGESIRLHSSRQATTGDWLGGDSGGCIAATPKEGTEAAFLPLHTYSVFGEKFVSHQNEDYSLK
jgi:hypothetical protein